MYAASALPLQQTCQEYVYVQLMEKKNASLKPILYSVKVAKTKNLSLFVKTSHHNRTSSFFWPKLGED